MKSIRYTLFALCLLCGLALPVIAVEPPVKKITNSSAQIGSVLLVYDEFDQVELVENMLTAFDQTVDKLEFGDYEKEMLSGYKHIIALTPIPLEDVAQGKKLLCIGEGFEIPGVTTQKNYGAGLEITADSFYQYLNFIDEFTVITDFEGKSFSKVSMSFEREYPFGIRSGDIYSVPYLSGENISTFALGEMLPDFFDSSYHGSIYVILQDVFAFSDLDMLCKTADELYLANIPFIVKVMPLYTNTGLDAFARYTQVLRYVESRGGAIVMTPPIVNGKATDEELEEMTAIATKALTAEGVTVLPSIEGFYFVDMEYLKEVKSPAKRYETFAFDVGILENLPRNEAELKQMVANLNGRWYEFGSYREKFGLSSKLFLETAVDEAIAGEENNAETSLFFSVGKDVLVIVVSILLVFIGALIYFSRAGYKRKFTKRER